MRRRRSGIPPSEAPIASSVLAILLATCAATSLSTIQWNLHLWQRLRSAGRESPQTSVDKYYRQLISFLPPAGLVCLVQLEPARNDPQASQIQYALAPRMIVSSDDCDFIVVAGRADKADALAAGKSLFVVHRFDEQLHLFKRHRQS
jgi:hypothetical protein